jgi:hypothetical protein
VEAALLSRLGGSFEEGLLSGLDLHGRGLLVDHLGIVINDDIVMDVKLIVHIYYADLKSS